MKQHKAFLTVLVLGTVVFGSLTGVRAELVFDAKTDEDTTAAVAEAQKAVTQQPVPSAVGTAAPTVIVVQSSGKSETGRPAEGEAASSPMRGSGLSVDSSAMESDSNTASGDSRLTRAELLRRERMRQEIKNEDLLKARLEELRLREEQRLHDRLLSEEQSSNSVGPSQDNIQIKQSAPAAVAPVVEVVAPTVLQSSGVSGTNQSVSQTASAVGVLEIDNPIQGKGFSISPDGGSFVLINPVLGLDARPRFSFGGRLGFAFDDYFGIEGGFHVNQTGIVSLSTIPLINQLIFNNQFLAQPFANESIVMNQYLADLSFKAHLTPRSIRIRPYLTAGAAYSYSNTNFSPALVSQLALINLRWDRGYDLHAIYATVGGGLDFQVTRNISLGISGRYYAPVTAFQANPFVYNGFALFGAGVERAVIGGTLGATPLVTILGSATFSF